MKWEKPKCIGDIPPKRSGHTFCLTGNFAYLFGGCALLNNGGLPGPTNQLFKVDISSDSEFYWTEVKSTTSILPCSRWHHTAITTNDDNIIIFGGFSSHKTQKHLNDVWFLDTNSDRWYQADYVSNKTKENESEPDCPWKGGSKRQEPPAPRGSHSATMIDNCMIIFGGYGGSGFARRDFDDMYAFCLESRTWYDVITNGKQPPARSGHQAVYAESKLYVMGGWNSSQQFDDVFILDKTTMSWSELEMACGPNSWGPNRWNFAAFSVFAVPYWKIFVFGGNSGNLDASRPQGEYRNDIQVLQCIESEKKDGVQSWSRPAAIGEIPPPRSDTAMFYSSDVGKLILFGGWSNRWFGDMYCCDINEVVGPPYNIFSIESKDWSSAIGPITGGSPMILKGKGFKSSFGKTATIRFACLKGFMDVSGEIQSDEEVHLQTPNFEKLGPVEAEVRLKISSQSFSSGVAKFKYFAVTDSRKTVAFGPGILAGSAPMYPTSFIIQAKDKFSNDRICGMDKFDISVHLLNPENDLKPMQAIDFTTIDNKNGTYLVQYTPLRAGKYNVSVNFLGTFQGLAGPIRGSPFIAEASNCIDPSCNDLNGKTLQDKIILSTSMLKDFSNATSKGLSKTVSKEDVKTLISIKEHLRNVKEKTKDFEVEIASNRAALRFLKRNGIKIPTLDKRVKDLEVAANSWFNTKSMTPLSSNRIEPTNKIWTEKMRFKIEAYERELEEKLKDFRKLPFWFDKDRNEVQLRRDVIQSSMQDAQKCLKSEYRVLEENAYLCSIFDLDGHIDHSKSIVEEMQLDLKEINRLWNVRQNLNDYISSSEALLWADIDIESLEEGGKAQLKAVKGLHKCTRWSNAYNAVDRCCKDFLSTIPLIALLRAKSMRPRHWDLLAKTTGARSFSPPYSNQNMCLGELLSLDLHRMSNEVEEICDQANKEDKMEKALEQIGCRWSGIIFTMTTYKNGMKDVPILGIGEEDFEALENDQLVIQGMLASRFVAQFEKQVTSWHKALFNVNEVFMLVSDIQRTWSYLEPLFIHSDEVRRELPEDATRFAIIDKTVIKILEKAWLTKNVKVAFNEPGLFSTLEGIQEQLDLCKKSLADFLDGRRRQFPRYYFVSEADLLDILSNGSRPENILQHISKIYLCTKTLVFATDERSATDRPIATQFVAGVGSEICKFEPPVPLEGKVEIYMQTILDAQKLSIFKTVKRSLVRYHKTRRPEWILSKESDSERPMDPAQTTLLVLAVNYVQEVENSFRGITTGNREALIDYSKKQVTQLSDLIKLTQSNLSKGDRTRVMVCITMDAHARDIVENMIRNKVDSIDSFIWQSQLKHKFRQSPPHARYQGRDALLRGDDGERVEIAICDAILPYDYEYLGNGPRLVITPLTDRVYVTATQALNLKMGCAPAGPAGTGKTETTKDLANALAKLIYVINCELINIAFKKNYEKKIANLLFNVFFIQFCLQVLLRWITKVWVIFLKVFHQVERGFALMNLIVLFQKYCLYVQSNSKPCVMVLQLMQLEFV